MSLQAVLLPLFVEVILTFVLMLRMGALRRADYGSGAVKADDIALREPRWPARTTQAANAFANQFELPVLFYVLTILSWVTRHAGIVFVVLACIFVDLQGAASLRACHQQRGALQELVLLCRRRGADGHVGALHYRSTDRRDHMTFLFACTAPETASRRISAAA